MRELPVEIINSIFEYANLGIHYFYSDKNKKYLIKINPFSLKYGDIYDLFMNRIFLCHTKHSCNFFNSLIQYDMSEIMIVPKNKKKVLYYKKILYCTLLREIEKLNK